MQRCDRHGASIVADQARKRQPVVGLLGKSEQLDVRCQQPVERSLDVHPHVAGKLPGGGHELAERNAFEVRVQNFERIIELAFRCVLLVFLFRLLLPLRHGVPPSTTETSMEQIRNMTAREGQAL